MSSSSRIIRGRSGSDFHLGHNVTPTEKIVDALDRLMTNDNVFANNDLIIFAGDVTERLLSQPSIEMRQARQWMARANELSAKHGTVLAVVEGTPLHDWKQPEYFVENNRQRTKPANLIYEKEVKIVYVEQLGIHILFVPDEAHDTCKLTEIAVRAELAKHNLEKVDLTILHGQFKHQYPEHLRDIGMDFHDSDFYLDITRHFIFAGHVHTHSIYKRIVAHGSIERLGQGYESPKGCVAFELNLDDPSKSKVWFIENTVAMIYKTFKVESDDLQYEADRIRNLSCKLPIGSRLRIMASEGNPILNLVREFRKEFPIFHWTGEVLKEKRKRVETVVPAKIKRARVSIRPDNIEELLADRLTSLNESERKSVLKVLEKCR